MYHIDHTDISCVYRYTIYIYTYVYMYDYMYIVIPTVAHVPMWVQPVKQQSFRPGGLQWYTCCSIHPYQLELSPFVTISNW